MFSKKPKHEHIYGKWEAREISARNSFNSTTRLIQERKCKECGWTDTRFTMSDISIKVDATVGSDIPGSIIPEMVRLANKIGICVKANLNDVTTIATPGDDPFHLAVAWRRALSSKHSHKFAFAHQGKELMERP